jgi:hypothetical protein
MEDFLTLLEREPENYVVLANLFSFYQQNPQWQKPLGERLRTLQQKNPSAVGLAVMVGTLINPAEKIDRKQTADLLWRTYCAAEWQ